MTHRNRLHSLLWSGAVVLAAAICLVLMLQVKAVNSQIAETEKAIIATKQHIAVLETEFQTRSRQQQLVRWNEVEFGYVAPRAAQFLDAGTQLAALGKPVEILESAPIRMAAAEVEADHAAAPVRMARADDGRIPLAGEDTPAIIAAQPVRVASAAPPMMRQLVARDDTKHATAKVAAVPRPIAAPAQPRSAQSFADRFDLDAVLSEGSH